MPKLGPQRDDEALASRRASADRKARPRANALDDRGGVGDVGVLERRGVGNRRLVSRDDPGIVEVVQALLGDGSQQAARPATGAGPLLDGEDPVGARY